MNKLLDAMEQENNVGLTANGGLTYKSTMDALEDLFAFGAAYRGRSDMDCILLFKKAFEEDESLALKCLFYLADVRGGQGERRFFRVVTRWLANYHTEAMRRNLAFVPEYTRWDNMYTFVDTPLEKDAFDIMREQLTLDVNSENPSLLAKWLKSENTSSRESCILATKTRMAFGMTPKQYRKTLATLRSRVRIVEKLMSENKWEDIEFDKLPSKAGLIYRQAFMKHIPEEYDKFAKDKSTKVNAKTLYPCDVVREAIRIGAGYNKLNPDDSDRLIVNKYWQNLEDYFHNATFNGVAVVDTSASMREGYGNSKISPIDVAIALGMYCAEKCNPNSPWYGNYITFSRQARLVPVEGIDFVDKVRRIYQANLCENTNIESVFDLILDLATANHLKQEDLMENIIIISDCQFDEARSTANWYHPAISVVPTETVMEKCTQKWQEAGYKIPHLVFWNVNASDGDCVPIKDNGNITFVSGFSPTLFQQVMTGKTGLELVMEKLNSERYAKIH